MLDGGHRFHLLAVAKIVSTRTAFTPASTPPTPHTGYTKRQWTEKRGKRKGGKLTINKMPLLIQPALRRLIPPLQNHVVALQPARKVIPRRRDQRVLALEVPDRLVRRRLCVLILVLAAARLPFPVPPFATPLLPPRSTTPLPRSSPSVGKA